MQQAPRQAFSLQAAAGGGYQFLSAHTADLSGNATVEKQSISCLETLTLDKLAAVPPQVQKQMIADRLYPLVKDVHSHLAGKITGMLLANLDNVELLNILESHEALKTKVNEAENLLRKKTKNQ